MYQVFVGTKGGEHGLSTMVDAFVVFDFEIFYKPGCENKAADGLSRSIALTGLLLYLTVPTVLQWEDLFSEIAADVEIQKKVNSGEAGFFEVYGE